MEKEFGMNADQAGSVLFVPILCPLCVAAACALLLAGMTTCSAQTIQRFTIARNDKLHESWPDLAIARNGDLVVAYQESDSHGGGPVSTIVSRVSTDQGRTWGERTVVAQLTNRRRDGWLNCSKLLRLQDKSILLAIDCIPQNPPPGANHFWPNNRAVIWLFRSHDNGRTWKGPEKTSIRGGIVPSLAQLRDGTLLVGITRFQEDDKWRQYQLVFRSSDNGKTWTGPLTVAKHPRRQPNEGDFVELDTGEVVCYMRDDEPGVKNGLKAISRDGGRTWGPLYGSGPWLYSGRPDVGLLSTGEVLLTSRVPGRRFGAYLETQKMALLPTPLSGPMTAGAFAAVIDTDTSPRPDYGYSGWVELPDGSVYAAQYITADAPASKPFIRGYLIPRGFFAQARQK
jgi:sialidase-1